MVGAATRFALVLTVLVVHDDDHSPRAIARSPLAPRIALVGLVDDGWGVQVQNSHGDFPS